MKSYLILGIGRFGKALATSLYTAGNEVFVIDNCVELINEIADSVTNAVAGDISDENVLRSVDAADFDTVVVAASGNMEVSIMATMILKELGCANVIVKASNKMHARILERIGADKVIMPEWDMGIKLAQSLTKGGLIDFIELSEDYSIMELSVPDSWIGRSLVDLEIRRHYGVNVIAVKSGDTINAELSADFVFSPRDVMVAIGSNRNLDKIK